MITPDLRKRDTPERAHSVFAGALEAAKGKLPRVVAELLVHAVPDRAKVVRRHLERKCCERQKVSQVRKIWSWEKEGLTWSKGTDVHLRTSPSSHSVS